MERTLVLGLGNTIRFDDAAGIITVRKLKERVNNGFYDFVELAETGFHLLGLMEEYSRVIIVDTFATKDAKPGYIHRYDLEQLERMTPPYSSHQLSLPTLIYFAKVFQITFPRAVVVYGLEVEKNDAFGEGLSPDVERALPQFIATIENELVAGNF